LSDGNFEMLGSGANQRDVEDSAEIAAQLIREIERAIAILKANACRPRMPKRVILALIVGHVDCFSGRPRKALGLCRPSVVQFLAGAYFGQHQVCSRLNLPSASGGDDVAASQWAARC
jgi:hypothetical protein